ncbi:hypothetical protein TNCV_3687571 [Trichonephila clavipes]|nr:hypothetical protein TNCV_3687571 [Trichonephila clavipes]
MKGFVTVWDYSRLVDFKCAPILSTPVHLHEDNQLYRSDDGACISMQHTSTDFHGVMSSCNRTTSRIRIWKCFGYEALSERCAFVISIPLTISPKIDLINLVIVCSKMHVSLISESSGPEGISVKIFDLLRSEPRSKLLWYHQFLRHTLKVCC